MDKSPKLGNVGELGGTTQGRQQEGKHGNRTVTSESQDKLSGASRAGFLFAPDRGLKDRLLDTIAGRNTQEINKERIQHEDVDNARLIDEIENKDDFTKYMMGLATDFKIRAEDAKLEKTPLRKMTESQLFRKKLLRKLGAVALVTVAFFIAVAGSVASGGALPAVVALVILSSMFLMGAYKLNSMANQYKMAASNDDVKADIESNSAILDSTLATIFSSMLSDIDEDSDKKSLQNIAKEAYKLLRSSKFKKHLHKSLSAFSYVVRDFMNTEESRPEDLGNKYIEAVSNVAYGFYDLSFTSQQQLLKKDKKLKQEGKNMLNQKINNPEVRSMLANLRHNIFSNDRMNTELEFKQRADELQEFTEKGFQLGIEKAQDKFHHRR